MNTDRARKALFAAALLADGYGKPKTAQEFREAAAELEEPNECSAHDTTEMLWPGTPHQGVVCRRCRRFLPC